ncbi:type II toxin-antitoxin system PemK/MazF family toxin [Pseudarthrobacter sulfonivorans]|uniref:type II toxin-antitoxin system PemK/MazF family toxin n=1 Tax=Pseudarthrobacter sulfonivorans TaxID=121292 RepID=UPI0021038CB1|nr:type II toxin-antitoxin system PemK/MazF family toxin [Pseudarthrobacter sulfonivorans]
MPINFRSLANAIRTSVKVLQKLRSGPAAPVPGRAVPGRAVPGKAAPGGRQPSPAAATGYPGDFQGVSVIRYAPQPDGSPDPGEIVWAWVPYEEDHSQGKDRPVLLIGHNGGYLLGLMLTSVDHDQPGHRSGDYVDIGTGAWDRQRRPSEANLGRILQLSPDSIRREGAVLDRNRFDLVSDGLRRRHGWK